MKKQAIHTMEQILTSLQVRLDGRGGGHRLHGLGGAHRLGPGSGAVVLVDLGAVGQSQGQGQGQGQ